MRCASIEMRREISTVDEEKKGMSETIKERAVKEGGMVLLSVYLLVGQ